MTLRVDARDEVRDRPFRGITVDGDDLIVQADGGHRIPHVVDVRLEQTDEGADAALEITSEDHTRTELRFRSPMHADLLDPAVE